MSACSFALNSLKTVRFSYEDCEKHFRKYVRRGHNTHGTTKLGYFSETNNTLGGELHQGI